MRGPYWMRHPTAGHVSCQDAQIAVFVETRQGKMPISPILPATFLDRTHRMPIFRKRGSENGHFAHIAGHVS